MMSHEGLICRNGCGSFVWADLEARIRSDGAGGLVWVWACPECHDEIRREPFAYPPDMPGTARERLEPFLLATVPVSETLWDEAREMAEATGLTRENLERAGRELAASLEEEIGDRHAGDVA